jgi:hypothetical protein
MTLDHAAFLEVLEAAQVALRFVGSPARLLDLRAWQSSADPWVAIKRPIILCSIRAARRAAVG